MERTIRHKIRVDPEELTLDQVSKFCRNLIDDGIDGDTRFHVDPYDGDHGDKARLSMYVIETKSIY